MCSLVHCYAARARAWQTVDVENRRCSNEYFNWDARFVHHRKEKTKTLTIESWSRQPTKRSTVEVANLRKDAGATLTGGRHQNWTLNKFQFQCLMSAWWMLSKSKEISWVLDKCKLSKFDERMSKRTMSVFRCDWMSFANSTCNGYICVYVRKNMNIIFMSKLNASRTL